MMVSQNTSIHSTPFTVSIDLLTHGCTTGISAYDRAQTILALTREETTPDEFGRPGHIFPLRAQSKGVLRRAGHTEAAIDFARLAGLYPAGALVEIKNPDGSMARLPELMRMAQEFGLKIVSVADLIKYRLKTESLIERGEAVKLPTRYGDFTMIPFLQKATGEEHVALIKGEWADDEPLLVRVHSSCMTGDTFGSLRCECGEQLHKALELIEKEGKGVLLYLHQEGRGIGLMAKAKAYKLQEQGYDTVDANLHLGYQADERDYGVGAQILRNLEVKKMRLMTNNPKKRIGLESYGLEVVENVPLEVSLNKYNHFYMETKKKRMGHQLRGIK
jgi:3,4-dihydroxy 2-butanone 4-phosphate synthase/GTP cyclohydrolase II